MAHKKQGVYIVIAVIFAFIVFAGIMIALYFSTNGFTENIKFFSVEINGEKYLNNAKGLVLDKNTSVTVSTENYDVSIYTKSVSNNFSFYVGEEQYEWSDTAYFDISAGFDVSVKGDTFVISYNNLASILSKALDYDMNDIYVPDVPTSEDLFVLSVRSGNGVIDISFTLSDLGGNADVEDVFLNTDKIVF